ncbi:MAG: sugar phosphorylase [Anaerolineales bacterium]|nr:MAG: sugar phosphorylase [Anaerolineales bacterium]
MIEDVLDDLAYLYGSGKAPEVDIRLQEIMAGYRTRLSAREGGVTERDAILITYGDQVKRPGEAPLRTLGTFCRHHLRDVVSGIHILPFYPWTSDDGFSVVDYRAIDPALGDWDDVAAMRDDFRLMFDAVVNHISSQSEWFQKFLQDDPQYKDYFIVMDGGEPNLSQVVRPRALPLLTSFQTPSGEKKVWTTFSDDQIDLDFKNPAVLLEIIDILLMYAERGADFIRLDAIAYLWKQTGTPCIHLPQTHRIIQLMRAVLDEIAPHVQLITETNVPHADNISYFGDGANEAQMVYNFALPPLTLHTFHMGDAHILSDWADSLTLPSDKTTFFNFLASHDGVGLNPARGILSTADSDSLVQMTLAHGGLISYKQNPDGSQSPYEMNINFFDALSNPHGDEPLSLQIDRFIAAQAIMLSLVGVPGIYFHSLFGLRNWSEGVKQTGRNRTINRQKCDFDSLQRNLANPSSLRSQVFSRYRDLLRARRRSPAFHPHGGQNVLDLHKSVFAVARTSPDGTSRAICLHNVSADTITPTTPFESAKDLLTGNIVNGTSLSLNPYQILWVTRT